MEECLYQGISAVIHQGEAALYDEVVNWNLVGMCWVKVKDRSVMERPLSYQNNFILHHQPYVTHE